jgi:2-methylaconitate cis-trans-isomerase PrpF
VAYPRSYTTVSGSIINERDISLAARVISMQKMHHAYALTGAICTAAAAKLKGTIVNEVCEDRVGDTIVIGHPKGTIAPVVRVEQQRIQEVTIARTARLLMKGEAYLQVA